MITDIAEWATVAAFVALFFLVCRVPAKYCPKGRYVCPCCMHLDTPDGERAAWECLIYLETAPTATRERP